MAAIKKITRLLFRTKTQTALVLVSLLFFCTLFSFSAQPLLADSYKKTDDLSGYLTALFEEIDEAPDLYINNMDSTIATIWRKPKTEDEVLAYYDVLINAAFHLLQKGMIPASTKWYEQALIFYDAQPSSAQAQMDYVEYVCKPLGNNYTRMGDFSKALQIQQRAIDAAVNQKEQLPSLYSNLATTYFYMQKYDSVQTVTDKGLENADEDNPAILLLENLKVQAFIDVKNIDKARFWSDKALATASSKFKSSPWYVTTLTDRAAILFSIKKETSAIKYLNNAWNLVDKNNKREQAKIAHRFGINYYSLAQYDSAKHWFQKALANFTSNKEGLYPDFTVTNSLFGIAESMAVLNPDSAAHWYEQAILNDFYTQQLLAGSLNSKTSIYDNERNTTKGIAFFHQLFAKTNNQEFVKKALWLTELSKGRKLIYNLQRTNKWRQDTLLSKNKELVDALRNDYLLLAEASDPQIKKTIQARIDEQEYALNLKEQHFSKSLTSPSYTQFSNWLDSAVKTKSLISFYLSDSSGFVAIATDKGYFHKIYVAASYKSLLQQTQSFIEHYYEKDPDAFNNNPDAYYSTASQLLQQWIPFTKSLNDELIIAPDNLLFSLPFEALSMTQNKADYFGANYNIAYTNSLLQNSYPSNTVKTTGVYFFGFDKEHLGFPALSESEKEKIYLRKKFNTATYNAAETDASKFFDALKSGNVLHLSTHAVADSNTQQPYIVLKDKLNLGQLQYTATNTPLVVLAACETGTGILQQNEGLQSLGRSFIMNGVKGVLASRWQVDDIITAKIIQLFYKHLQEVGVPSKALQMARREYLQQEKSIAGKNPRNWSALFYQGIDAPIQLQKKSGNYWAFLLATVVIAIGAILFWQKRKKTFKKG